MSDASWESLILTAQPPEAAWRSIFGRLRDAALAAPSPAAMHRETIVPDRLLAESAWDLWQEFPNAAPSVVAGLREFWAASSGAAGSAVLILDALSLREMPQIAAAARKHGVEPVRCEVRGSHVPTETEGFSQALGLQTRSKLFNNQPPASFIFNGPDTHTDVIDAPFADCVSSVPAKPRLFIWHKWPDEPLIHLHADKVEGDTIVATEIKKQLASEGFWQFVDRLRQGRRLVITGDHGYAIPLPRHPRRDKARWLAEGYRRGQPLATCHTHERTTTRLATAAIPCAYRAAPSSFSPSVLPA